MTAHSLPVRLFPLIFVFALAAASCQSAALQANQTQIEQQQGEIATLKAQQSYATPMPPPGSCDRDVMAKATRQGGEKYASGDYSKALGYYQDALSACPGDARAELNVGRAYEALNDREHALDYYQRAASSGDPAEKDAETEAHADLVRLGGALGR